ncbi:unnamed protein product [Closterium sp. NIES-64]|nr:unnamed protein product [Closterium sp. NIES-64]
MARCLTAASEEQVSSNGLPHDCQRVTGLLPCNGYTTVQHKMAAGEQLLATSGVAISEAPKLQFLREEGRQHSGTVGRRPIRSQGGDGGGREGWGRGGGGGGGGEEVAGVEGWEGRAMELLLLLVEERVEHLMEHDRAMGLLLLLVEREDRAPDGCTTGET